MPRKMLINAQRAEEVRVAIVLDGKLDRYEVATAASGLVRGNIYRGVVTSVRAALSAAFVDIGLERDGLLRADDVVPPAYHKKVEGRRLPIDKIMEVGKPVLVQVVRDGVGEKGTLLTTNVSLAGRYLVVMPFDDVRGVSRRAEDEEVRTEIKERLTAMSLPEGFGVIARTNALDQPKTSLNRDLSALLRLWKRIRKEESEGRGTKLLYSDQDLIVQAMRDFLDSSVDEVLVDSDAAFEHAEDYMRSFMPRAKTQLVRYSERMPLFSRFELESQIDRISMRQVELPSGGSIVIDGTEALTAIDVNSGRGSRGASQEEMAYNTNMEAAREIGRHLRLRDIGGLVVVDFIDMRSSKHERNVEKALRDAMKDDKARFTVGRISPNGLLEVNRQRLKKSLALRTHRQCPTCGGSGTIASPDQVGLNLLRRIETRAVTGRLKGVRVGLHPELADAIQNGRRQEIAEIEREFGLKVEIIAATNLHRSDEKIEWFLAEDDRPIAQPKAAAVSVADLAGEVRRGAASAKAARAEETSPAEPEAGVEAEPAPRSSSGRRRRRSGSRKPAASEAEATPVEMAAPTAAAAEDAVVAGDEEEAQQKSARRRRRGGRRRRKPTASTADPEPDDLTATDDSSAGHGGEAATRPGDAVEVASPAVADEATPGPIPEPSAPAVGSDEAAAKKRRWWSRRK